MTPTVLVLLLAMLALILLATKRKHRIRRCVFCVCARVCVGLDTGTLNRVAISPTRPGLMTLAPLALLLLVSLLVADSRLARAVLSGHEAGQEGRVIMAEVEGDTLRQYSQLLRTGTTEIKAGDR